MVCYTARNFPDSGNSLNLMTFCISRYFHIAYIFVLTSFPALINDSFHFCCELWVHILSGVCPSSIEIGLKSCKWNLITCVNEGWSVNGTRNSEVHLCQEFISMSHFNTEGIQTLLCSTTHCVYYLENFVNYSGRGTLNTVDAKLLSASMPLHVHVSLPFSATPAC